MFEKNPSELPGNARVWIYQAKRFLSHEEQNVASQMLTIFCEGWLTHGKPVRSSFEIEHGLFILLYAIEEEDGVSGCSIDSSVAAMKDLEQKLGVDLFDRQTVAWEQDGEICLTPMHEFWALRKAGRITGETMVFDNLINTLSEKAERWRTSFDESWHSSMW